jgi:hypothetical protein
MKRALPILLFSLGFGSYFSFSQTPNSSKPELQSPLDSYIEGLRKDQLNSAAAEFTKVCGVRLDEAAHKFAFSNNDAGTWKMVVSLPEAYDNIGMDLVETAEVWKNAAGTVVEEWEAALDVGGFQRSLYCFDAKGQLKALDTANYQIPDDGEPWGMHEQWILQAGNTFRAVIPFEFIGLDDNPIRRPKLDADYETFVASWGKKPPKAITIHEMELPAALFQ